MNNRNRLTLLAAAALLAAGPALAQQSDAFKRLDKDKDGFISKSEAVDAKAFGVADENKDGRLDADEFLKYQSIQTRSSAGKYVDDSMVTAKVKTALAKELAADSISVSVETYRGKVILSGFVDNDGQRQKAASVTKGVEGVTEVKNALEVK